MYYRVYVGPVALFLPSTHQFPSPIGTEVHVSVGDSDLIDPRIVEFLDQYNSTDHILTVGKHIDNFNGSYGPNHKGFIMCLYMEEWDPVTDHEEDSITGPDTPVTINDATVVAMKAVGWQHPT